MKLSFRFCSALIGSFALLPALSPAVAQEQWPSRPMRWMMPVAPGGALDATARLLQQPLTQVLGQPIVIENRAGGSGVIATDTVVRSPPDGLTFAVVYSSHAANPALLKTLPYDSEKDFEPVAFIWRAATAISVHPSVPINTFAQFLAEAKSKPGSIAYGTPGVGSAMHLAGALLEDRAGIVLTHIPYRGAGPALADAIAGGVPAVISNVSTTAPQAKFGKLRPLATTGPKRSMLLPDIPTIAESGFPGYDVAEFMVLVARAGTPIEILDRKHRAILNVVAAPAMATKLAEQGLDTQPMSRAEVKTWLAAQTRTLSDLIRKAGIKPE